MVDTIQLGVGTSGPLSPSGRCTSVTTPKGKSERTMQSPKPSHYKQAQQAQQAQRECSMCGDVGIQKELFRCTSCRQRYQHRYCSSFYPNLAKDEGQWICDWCLVQKPKSPKSQQQQQQQIQAMKIIPQQHDKPPAIRPSVALQSPLDLLLEVAESTLNLEIAAKKGALEKQQQQVGIRRVASMPASVKKYREGCSENVKHMPLERLHKRKRCADMDKEELRRGSCNKAAIAAKPSPLRPPPPPQLQFSPSKGVVGRRYRLLSEVLC